MQNKKNKLYFLLAMCMVLCLAAGTGFMYAKLQGGQLFDVGGFKLYAEAAGDDKPVVVLEAGYGSWSTDWAGVVQELSKYATIFTYDRAGLGKSDPSSRPRTSAEQADQLHTLLEKAKLHGPYILVGHSLGGITMRVFAAKYPEKVEGIVLVDSSHEEQNVRLYNALSPEIQEMYASQFVDEGSYDEVQQSLDQALATRTAIRNLPLYVITAGFHGMNPEAEAVWQELQKELVSLSKKGKQVMALEYSHNVHKENPMLVAGIIKQMIDQVK